MFGRRQLLIIQASDFLLDSLDSADHLGTVDAVGGQFIEERLRLRETPSLGLANERRICR